MRDRNRLMLLLITYIFVVMLAANTVEALQCYKCSGNDHSDCKDEYGGVSAHKVDCGSDGGCAKRKVYHKVFGYSEWITVRGCGEIYTNAHCGKWNAIEKNEVGLWFKAWECSCSGGLCNSAVTLPSVSASIIVAFSSAAAAMMRYCV